ncbi:MAG: hypothetical protein AAF125_23135, partial [Chloroflexota bacterium]
MRRYIVLVMLVLVGCSAQPQPVSEKAIIEWGWNTPRLQDFPQYTESGRLNELPFNGAVIDVATPLDERGLSWTLFTDAPVDEALLISLGEEYGDLDWGRYQHNFLRMNVYPADIAWDDDTAWETIYANAEAWARLANDLGFRGIMLDTEQYGDGVTIFDSTVRRSVTSEYAYERGIMFIEAIERGYPDLTVMTTFALTI